MVRYGQKDRLVSCDFNKKLDSLDEFPVKKANPKRLHTGQPHFSNILDTDLEDRTGAAGLRNLGVAPQGQQEGPVVCERSVSPPYEWQCPG